MNVPLFRTEALAQQRARWLGDIVLMRPITLEVLAILAAVSAAAMLALLYWGQYTRHTNVSGVLVPDLGLVRVYAPQNGVVSEKHVVEGQHVMAGEVLYVLSDERRDGSSSYVQAAISRAVEARKHSWLRISRNVTADFASS